MREDQHQNQTRFTTEDTKATERRMTPEQQAEALALKLAQTYDELTRLLERNPRVKRQITEGEAREEKVYQDLKQRLKLADMAPRCRWVKQDGTACGSPQMKKHIYCFAHMQMMEARELALRLPAPEDANAIQIGLMRIQKSLTEDTISTKKAGLLLYSMQLALMNVGRTTFGQAKEEEMVRDTVDECEAIKQDLTPTTETRRHGEEKNQNQRPFTTEDTKDTEKGLPLIDVDRRGLKMEIRPVEWKPTPDMYRMDTREGREAYEASLRRSSERKPVPAVIAPERDSETYYSPLWDERLPKGPRFASEPLDADTCAGSAFQTEPCANLG